METEYRDRGIEAYQEKDFARAIEYLSATPEQQWDARLYLGMSLYMCGRHEEARAQFMKLKDACPNVDIRTKAAAAFVAVNSKIIEAEKALRREDEEEVEW